MQIYILVFITLAWLNQADALATMAIDLGAEFMKIAIVKPGVPMEIALNRESQRKTPVVVSIRGSEREIGEPALNTAIKFPSDAFIFTPSVIGRSLNNPAVSLYKERFPFYNLEENPSGVLTYLTKDKSKFDIEEIVAMLLENAMETAQKFAENPIKDAVITVPPYFGQAERKAVIRAAEYAGISVLQLMNSNTAVALNYGIFRSKHFNKTAQYYMFFDMGSTSTTATIVSYQVTKVREGSVLEEHPQLTVLGVGFDETLGATSFILRVRDHLAKKFNEKKLSKKDITKNERSMAKLFIEAGRVVRILSANKGGYAQVENVFDNQDFKVHVTRDEVEGLCKDLFDRVQRPVDSALEMAQIPLATIKEVILMGGGTRIPKVQDILLSATQKTELGKSINTDEAAALGAVYQAAHLSPGFRVKRFVVKDAALFPLSVSFKSAEDNKEIVKVIFNLGNPYPQKKVMTFNRHTKNFDFQLSYSDMPHLNDFQRKSLGPQSLAEYKLEGVEEAMKKFDKPGATAKGVKAHFRLDDSGIVSLDRVEALFEVAPGSEAAAEQDSSTLSKIGESIGNLFSSAKAKADENKTEDASAKLNDTTSDTLVNKTDSANKTKINGTDTTKENKTAKAEIYRESILFKTVNLNAKEPSQETKQASRSKILELRKRDQEKTLLEKSKNELESFMFDAKDKLETEDFVKCSTEDERSKMMEKLREAQDWYDEQGMDTKRDEYVNRLTTLKTLTADVFTRVQEMRQRPAALKALKDMLNTTRNFFDGMKNMTGEGNVFTETELTSLGKLINDTTAWQKEREKELAKADLAKEPPIRIEDIRTKMSSLEREISYLLNKLKYWVPPTPQPTEKTSDNTTTDKDATQTDSKSDSSDNQSAKGEPETKQTDEKSTSGAPPTSPPTESSKKDDSSADGHKPDDEL